MQVLGWFHSINTSVLTNSCLFVTVGFKRCLIGYISLTFKQSLYKESTKLKPYICMCYLQRSGLRIWSILGEESWKILALELQL